jgi:hypothetical protein
LNCDLIAVSGLQLSCQGICIKARIHSDSNFTSKSDLSSLHDVIIWKAIAEQWTLSRTQSSTELSISHRYHSHNYICIQNTQKPKDPSLAFSIQHDVLQHNIWGSSSVPPPPKESSQCGADFLHSLYKAQPLIRSLNAIEFQWWEMFSTLDSNRGPLQLNTPKFLWYDNWYLQVEHEMSSYTESYPTDGSMMLPNLVTCHNSSNIQISFSNNRKYRKHQLSYKELASHTRVKWSVQLLDSCSIQIRCQNTVIYSKHYRHVSSSGRGSVNLTHIKSTHIQWRAIARILCARLYTSTALHPKRYHNRATSLSLTAVPTGKQWSDWYHFSIKESNYLKWIILKVLCCFYMTVMSNVTSFSSNLMPRNINTVYVTLT